MCDHPHRVTNYAGEIVCEDCHKKISEKKSKKLVLPHKDFIVNVMLAHSEQVKRGKEY